MKEKFRFILWERNFLFVGLVRFFNYSGVARPNGFIRAGTVGASIFLCALLDALFTKDPQGALSFFGGFNTFYSL
jgi:hypothetical protein